MPLSWVTQAVLPYMRERGAGHIIQVSSIGGVQAFPMLGLYHGWQSQPCLGSLDSGHRVGLTFNGDLSSRPPAGNEQKEFRRTTA
jgi:NAD(P)-dependent dehydrogenase (short-subunit alcohol dehydrogenase family)